MLNHVKPNEFYACRLKDGRAALVTKSATADRWTVFPIGDPCQFASVSVTGIPTLSDPNVYAVVAVADHPLVIDPPKPPLNIRPNKSYRLRNGKIAYIVAVADERLNFRYPAVGFIEGEANWYAWNNLGLLIENQELPYDLVEEIKNA